MTVIPVLRAIVSIGGAASLAAPGVTDSPRPACLSSCEFVSGVGDGPPSSGTIGDLVAHRKSDDVSVPLNPADGSFNEESS